MTSKEEKARRRAIKRELAKKEIEQAKTDLPLSPEILRQLFDYVDEKTFVEVDGKVISRCDHTTRNTRKFLEERGLRHKEESVLGWLVRHGGCCDCEVMVNAADYWFHYMEEG